jgi:two-component system sensor histidine kinase UhpB
MTDSIPADLTVAQSLLRLMESDHQSVVRLIHDDIGQSLVAIRSIAEAILDQNGHESDETGELVDLIKQTTDSAYRSAYDLMQELRAQDAASADIPAALEHCLEESRLADKLIDFKIYTPGDVDGLDVATRAFILRNVRCFVNACKQFANGGCITVKIPVNTPESTHRVTLNLIYIGKLELGTQDLDDHFVAMKNRVEAIGGLFLTDLDDTQQLNLSLCFNPLFPASVSKT